MNKPSDKPAHASDWPLGTLLLVLAAVYAFSYPPLVRLQGAPTAKISRRIGGAAALERFNREWPCLKEGRTPPPLDDDGGCTIVDLVNTFLSVKLDAVENGELSERAFANSHRCCEWLLGNFDRNRRGDDLRPEDFAALRSSIVKGKDGRGGRGPVTVRNEINRTRVLMKFACDHRLIDKPVHYGQSFNRPSAKTLRRARNEAGPRLFEREELKLLLDFLDGEPVTVEGEDEPITRRPSPIMKAMVLLGLNCGFGDTDVASCQADGHRHTVGRCPTRKLHSMEHRVVRNIGWRRPATVCDSVQP